MRSILVPSLLGALLLAGGFTSEAEAQAKKSATVFLSNLSQTYNGSPRSASASTTASGFSSFKFTYNGSSFAPTAAGSYSVVCTLVNDKYQGQATGTLVISRATATVTLGNLNQTYNGSPRSVTATTTATGSSKFTITYNGSSTAPTAVGSYNVACKLENANYQGSTTGTLVIAGPKATVQLGNLSQTYNGSPRPVTATTSATGNSSFTFTYNGSSVAPTAAGSYNVVAKLVNANYQGSTTGTLVIAKAQATLQLGNLSQTFNGSPRSVTATSNATGNSSFTFTYNGSSVAPTAPGSYAVVATLTNPNYQGNAWGTLVISRASSTTTLTLSPTKAMVGQTVTLTATVKSPVNGVLPSGTVTFKDGARSLTPEPVKLENKNGVVTATFRLTLTAGSHAFAADYSGDTNFAASTSPATP